MIALETSPERARAPGGYHVCDLRDAGAVSTEFLCRFASRGRARGERVLWLVDDRGAGPLARLARRCSGGDGAALAEDAVGVAQEAYVRGGRFDVDGMLEHYADEISATLRRSCTGLRVIADMSWVSGRPDVLEPLAEYERRVGELFDRGGFAAALGELAGGAGNVHVDRSGLGFLDVAGCRALVRLAGGHPRSRGGPWGCRGGVPQVRVAVADGHPGRQLSPCGARSSSWRWPCCPSRSCSRSAAASW